MDIFALPSFEMKAEIQVENLGKPLGGSYTLFWNGPAQWREEIDIPGYSEIQVGGKDVIYLKRTMDFVPLRISQLHSVLGYGSSPREGMFSHLELRPNETVKKTHERNVNGIKAECIEVVNEEKHTIEFCIDASSGTLIRQGPFRDKEYRSDRTKVIPTFLKLGRRREESR